MGFTQLDFLTKDVGASRFTCYEKVTSALPQRYPLGSGGANITSLFLGKPNSYPNSYSAPIHINSHTP
jgi:hypothetical protein